MKRWWDVAILSIFGISLIPVVVIGTWSPSDAALVFVALGAFVVSIFNLRELRNQRRDSQKPLLVPMKPISNRVKIAPRFIQDGEKPHEFNEREDLRVRNIGAGPAKNISVRVEDRLDNASNIKDISTLVSPLGIGDEGFVQNLIDGSTILISNRYWVVIIYEDIFGNKFETECQWSGGIWHNFKTEPVRS